MKLLQRHDLWIVHLKTTFIFINITDGFAEIDIFGKKGHNCNYRLQLNSRCNRL